jgi:peptide/nickel transport system permease protein
VTLTAGRMVGTRVLLAVPTVGFVLVGSFLLMALMPGDPAAILAGDDPTPERIEAIRRQQGLDRPLPIQLVTYVGDVLRGDLGRSLSGKTVAEAVTYALGPTLSLLALAMLVALAVGPLAGWIAAVNRDKLVDRAVTAVSAVLLATPYFVVAVVLVVVFAVNNRILPALGYVPIQQGVGEWLRHLLLPAFALSLAPMAEMARQSRAALVGTFEQDFMRTVRARGLTRRGIARHALKNSARPVVTVSGLQVARLLGGAVVVEIIFAMPGLGSLAYSAVTFRDIPTMRGIVLVSSLLVVLVNLLMDILNAYLDPRQSA